MFRTASRDEELELVSRVQILHIIELRAAGWVTNDNMVNYYKQRLSHMDNIENRMSRDSPQVDTSEIPEMKITFNLSSDLPHGPNQSER